MWKKILFSFFIAILTIFIVGEIFVRVFNKYKAFNELDCPKYKRYGKIFHHSFIPNSKGRYSRKEYSTIYYINSFGLRDREYNLKKAHTTYRIIMMGDSFVEGMGVNIEDTFTKKLELLLNENNQSRDISEYEVINAGIISYSPMLEYIMLKRKLLDMGPDMIILCFDLSDIQDDYCYSKTALFDGEGDLEAVSVDKEVLERPQKIFLIRFLERHSPFYLYARRKIKKLFTQISQRQEKEPQIEFGNIETDRLFMLRDNVDIKTHWGRTASYIIKIKKLLDEKNIEFTLITYPYGHQVNKDEWAEGRCSWGFDKEVLYNNDKIFNIIEDFCSKNNINLIQTHKELREVEECPLYYKYDGHFTKLGNSVMAGIIYRKLLPILASYSIER